MLEMLENNSNDGSNQWKDEKTEKVARVLESRLQKNRSNQATTLTGFFLVAVVFALDAFAVAEALLGQ